MYGYVGAFVCWDRDDRVEALAKFCAHHRKRHDDRKTSSLIHAQDESGLSGKPFAWELERK